MDPRVPVPVASVILCDDGTQRKVGNGDSQLAPLEVISSLATRLLRTAQEGWLVDVKIPPEEGMGSSSAAPAAVGTERGHSAREWARVCFSCGWPGHGVNRCSQVDTSFPFLSPGWAVDVRDGQYRVVMTGGTGRWSAPGNEGWPGREGQPPGSLGTKVRLTQAGEMEDQGEAGWHGSCRWGLATAGHRARTLFRRWGAIPLMFVGRITDSCRSGPGRGWEATTVPDPPIGMGGGPRSVGPPVSGARKNGRGMRPAGGDRRYPPKVRDGQSDVSDRMMIASDGPVGRGNNRVVPLSVEAEELSLKTVPKNRVPTGEESDSSEKCVPSREMHEGVVGQSEAVVSTTALAGVAAPSIFAGAAALADLAGTDVPAVAGMKLSAVAEVYSSAVDAEDVPFVIQASRRWHAVAGAGPVWPGGETVDLVDDMTVPELLEHSVVGVSDEASRRRRAVVEVGPVWPGGETVNLVDDMTVPEPLEYSVVGVPNEVGNRSVDMVTVSEPIEHSVVVRGPHEVGNSSGDIVTGSNLMEHSGVRGNADLPSACQLILNSEISRSWEKGQQDRMCDDNMPWDG